VTGGGGVEESVYIDIGFEGCKEKIKNWLIRAFVVFLFTFD